MRVKSKAVRAPVSTPSPAQSLVCHDAEVLTPELSTQTMDPKGAASLLILEFEGRGSSAQNRNNFKKQRMRSSSEDMKLLAGLQFIQASITCVGSNSGHIPTQKQIQKAGMDTRWQQVGRNFLREMNVVTIDTKTRLQPKFATLGQARSYLKQLQQNTDSRRSQFGSGGLEEGEGEDDEQSDAEDAKNEEKEAEKEEEE